MLSHTVGVCVECCLLFEEQAFLVAMRSRLQMEHQVSRTVAGDVTQLTHDLLLHVRPGEKDGGEDCYLMAKSIENFIYCHFFTSLDSGLRDPSEPALTSNQIQLNLLQ